MKKSIACVELLTAISKSTDDSFVASLLVVIWRMIAATVAFSRREVTPKSFEVLERRLERTTRELGRLVLEHSVANIESNQRPEPIHWEHRKFSPNRRTRRIVDTRRGTIHFRRWFFQSELIFVRGFAPLDQRLGLVGNRVSPGLAHKLGRLAADLPQQPAIKQLGEQFNVTLSVDTYRRVVEALSTEVAYLHDRQATEQLVRWIQLVPGT